MVRPMRTALGADTFLGRLHHQGVNTWLVKVGKVNLVVNIGLHDNGVIRTVHSFSLDDELKPIANFYQVDVNQLAFKCRFFTRNCVICKIGLDT